MYLTVSQNMASYDFFYKSTIQTSFWKEMCQKSKMDTTIDFVKHPKHSRINIFLNILFQKSGIGES